MKERTSLATAWVDFLDQIDAARSYVSCTSSAAWFRGHADSKWTLAPSLMRCGAEEDHDDDEPIKRMKDEIETHEEGWRQKLKNKTILKKRLQEKPAEPDLSVLRSQYHHTLKEADRFKRKVVDLKDNLMRFTAPIGGERELFDEFVFRAGKPHSDSSWQILAEMRHYGIQTRLLDWTDRLDIALYFALDHYRGIGFAEKDYNEVLDAANKLPRPCIWILNPYTLSKRFTGRTSIWDIAREPTYDYYARLLVEKNWPFDHPISIYPPARIERIRSQRGYFSVFGNKKEPMERQIASRTRCLIKVDLTVEAAIFCLQYLSSVQGLSKFEVYRDLDSLGQELATRFTKMHENSGR